MSEQTPPDFDAQELAALRARAYGPHADITADPDAMRRLAALERAAASVPTSSEVPAAPAARAAPAEQPDASHEPHTSASHQTPERPDASQPTAGTAEQSETGIRARRRRRRLRMPVALTVVAGAALCALGAAAALVVVADAAPHTPQPTAQLHLGAQANNTPDLSAQVRDVFRSWGAEPDTMRVSARFGQAFAWVALTHGGQTCLIVTIGAPVEVINGSANLVPGGCAPSGQEPAVDLWTGDVANESVLPGTVDARSWVRFRPDGDTVQVWVTHVPSAA